MDHVDCGQISPAVPAEAPGMLASPAKVSLGQISTVMLLTCVLSNEKWLLLLEATKFWGGLLHSKS